MGGAAQSFLREKFHSISKAIMAISKLLGMKCNIEHQLTPKFLISPFSPLHVAVARSHIFSEKAMMILIHSNVRSAT